MLRTEIAVCQSDENDFNVVSKVEKNYSKGANVQKQVKEWRSLET